MADRSGAANDREITEQELEEVSGGLIPKAGSSEFPDTTMVPPAPSSTPTPVPNPGTDGVQPPPKQ